MIHVQRWLVTTLFGLMLGELFVTPSVLALDAETQRLEQEVLCQAMPYRGECGGKPRVAPTPALPASPVPPETRSTAKPGKEDFLRAAGAICLADLDYYQAMAPGTSRTEIWVACVRAYLAREGFTLP